MPDHKICKAPMLPAFRKTPPIQIWQYLIQCLGREIKADGLIKILLSKITVHRPILD
jgi:hypothetical protein